ncbi:MAG: DctP family TRAP transporter solute-binding subunit [Oscillospiraceae bacterium]
MKKTNASQKAIAVLLSLLMILSLAACSGGSAGTGTSSGSAATSSTASSATVTGVEYTEAKLLMSTTVGENSNAAKMCVLFADKVKEATGGAVEISTYPSDQLSGGDMPKGVDLLVNGSTDCAFEPVDVISSLDQSLLTLNLAWNLDSYDKAESMLNATAGQYVADKMSAQGITTLGFIHNGLRQLTNNKHEVTTLADLSDLKLRVPGGEPFMKVFTILGADPLTLSFSELYTALSQSTVDGQENGFDLIYNNSFYEVQKYITVWNYSYGAFGLFFNTESWDKLNDATKAVLQSCAQEVCRTGCQNVVDNEASQRQAIVDYGVKVTDLTADQIKVFKDKLISDGYYDYFYEKYGADAFTAFGIDISAVTAK